MSKSVCAKPFRFSCLWPQFVQNVLRRHVFTSQQKQSGSVHLACCSSGTSGIWSTFDFSTPTLRGRPNIFITFQEKGKTNQFMESEEWLKTNWNFQCCKDIALKFLLSEHHFSLERCQEVGKPSNYSGGIFWLGRNWEALKESQEPVLVRFPIQILGQGGLDKHQRLWEAFSF